MSSLRNKLSYTQIIVLSFLIIILVGAFLLALPVSSRDHSWTSPLDALFTATSSTCVVGLLVLDTYSHWSPFGQAVLLVLIQIGGLGVMTCLATLSLILNRRISIAERRLLIQSAGLLRHSGVVLLLRRIVFGTAIAELCGALLLSVAFIPKMGFSSGLWNAVFHSVSAFCNAGFDLMGKYGAYSSFTNAEFSNSPLVLITLTLLIISGGIGFLVWNDISQKRRKFKEYEVHTKIVLSATVSLLVLGTVLFFIFEYNGALADMSFGQKLLHSFFQSVSPRTAGFNSVSLSSLSVSAGLLITLLMLIGGSPGSTAGGIKTTTFVVLLLNAWGSARRYGSTTAFKRKLEKETVAQASAIVTVYVCVIFVAVIIIGALEPHSLSEVLFEVVSAVATVGLSTGITPSLCAASHIILAILMFAGRIGGLTFVLVLAERRVNVPIDRPPAKILIG